MREQTQQAIKILFLGQCLNYGYQGVDRSSTFSSLTTSMLRARFPGLRFKIDRKYFYHPLGLKALLRHRVLLSRPDLAVINLPAMFAATHWRVSKVYEIAPEIVDTARNFAHRIEARVRGKPPGECFETLIDRTSTIHGPVALDDYERLIEDAVRSCGSAHRCRFVLMGPGRFNDDTIESYPIHSPELWSSVNQMVLGLGERLGLPVINTQEALEEHGGEVFIPKNHRFSPYGHEVVAREVERVLASQILGLSAGDIKLSVAPIES